MQYAVPEGSIDYWKNRLNGIDIKINEEREHFGRSVLSLNDNDGMNIDLVEDENVNDIDTKGEGGIEDDHAIRGFFGTTLSLADVSPTAELLREFGWQQESTEKDIQRFTSNADNKLGKTVDLQIAPELKGKFGRGSIHHVAFRVPDDDAQAEWREHLIDMGFQVTPVQNRDYFRSIYFREPGGVLFELATDGPGFTKDEPLEELGSTLKIPSWYEKNRKEIEAKLPELSD